MDEPPGSEIEVRDTLEDKIKLQIINSVKRGSQILGIGETVNRIYYVQTQGNYSAGHEPYYDPDGKRSIDLEAPIDPDEHGALDRIQKHALAHEVGHVLLNSSGERFVIDSVAAQIVDEGIVEYMAVMLMMEETYGFDYGPVESRLQQTVFDNIDELEKIFYENHSIVARRGKYFWDGYLKERSMVHIAGMNFVFKVLGPDKLHKWRYVKDNPPTFEELVDPTKYLEKHAGDLEKAQYQQLSLAQSPEIIYTKEKVD